MADIVIEKPNVKEITQTKSKPVLPKMYKVIIHNDDKTPMDLVIEILMDVFKMNINKAEKITWDIHNSRAGVAGVYPYEIAKSKKSKAIEIAQRENYSLAVTIEEDK